MTRRTPDPVLLLALGAAVALWFFSRTQRGSEMVGKVVSAAGDATAAVRDLLAPRGIRNHNPGNIERTADRWRGMSADQSSDPRFVVFDSPVWGLRALARILRQYMARGATTVRAIVNTWAPPVENDTGAYVQAVADAIGVDPDAPIDGSDATMSMLMQAITHHENGQQPYGPDVFAQALQLERSA
jgi:hypothetical protein